MRVRLPSDHNPYNKIHPTSFPRSMLSAQERLADLRSRCEFQAIRNAEDARNQVAFGISFVLIVFIPLTIAALQPVFWTDQVGIWLATQFIAMGPPLVAGFLFVGIRGWTSARKDASRFGLHVRFRSRFQEMKREALTNYVPMPEADRRKEWDRRSNRLEADASARRQDAWFILMFSFVMVPFVLLIFIWPLISWLGFAIGLSVTLLLEIIAVFAMPAAGLTFQRMFREAELRLFEEDLRALSNDNADEQKPTASP